MRDLHTGGLHGRLPCFIEGFLKKKKVSRTTRCMHLRPLRSGNGCTTRQYPISNFIWS